VDLLRVFDASHLSTRFPHELSSGQAQVLALCVALLRPADVLLFDEPEQRLDDDRVDALVGLLQTRQEAGATLLIATHDPRLVAACDTVVRLHAAGSDPGDRSGSRADDGCGVESRAAERQNTRGRRD
jgi:ABC-type lipoprotein export system ATPase subunit